MTAYNLFIKDIIPEINETTESLLLFYLAEYYYINRDFELLHIYYKLLAERPDHYSQYLAGIFMEIYGNKDYMIKHYLNSISQGNKEAMMDLACHYYMNKQIVEAKKYLLMAIEKGNTEAKGLYEDMFGKN